jgi:glycosyltransferase involved in cell wall biosynthesis
LGILVAGMAFHNLLLMAMLSLDTPSLMVRGVQFWKEAVLVLLAIIVAKKAWATIRSGRMPRLLLPDVVASLFALLVIAYMFVPDSAMGSDTTWAQRLVGFRMLILLPLLYAFGRVFWPVRRSDLIWVARAILGAAVVVGLFGLWELWFVPTSTWLDWGVKQFTSWLGFAYKGPQGLPENFFQSTAGGLGLRRMVSTYISPLGIAYTGLLLVPVVVALVSTKRGEAHLSRWFRWTALVLVVVSILFSMTRGALVSMVAELALLFLLFRSLRVLAIACVVTLAVGFMLFEYVNFGPLVTFDLKDVRPPAGYALVLQLARAISGASDVHQPTGHNLPNPTESGELVERTISAEDPSASGHLAALKHGIEYVQRHPLGTGLGSAVPRYGTAEGPGESALLATAGELGVIGVLLYIAMYAFALWYGLRAFWRVRGDPLLSAFALVAPVGGFALIPIMITSNVWGNFSVTFLLWWCAGFNLALCERNRAELSPHALNGSASRPVPVATMTGRPLSARRGDEHREETHARPAGSNMSCEFDTCDWREGEPEGLGSGHHRLCVALDMTFPDRDAGGSGVYARSLLAALRHKPHLELCEVRAQGRGLPATLKWLVAGARREVVRRGAHLLHCPAFVAPPVMPVPVVLNVHDAAARRYPHDYPAEWRLYDRYLLPRAVRRAAAVIVPSEHSRRDVIGYYGAPPDRTFVTHFAPDPAYVPQPGNAVDALLTEYNLPEPTSEGGGTPLLLFSGAPLSRKNLDVVLRALAYAPPESALSKAVLVIAGAWAHEFPRYSRWAEAHGLVHRVRWLGRLPADKMPALYAAVDLLVYPSFYEGFGLPPLEAMAVGTPVVASNASCLPEVLGDAALLVPPHNHLDFGHAVEAVLTDPALRARLVEAGKKRAALYTWARCAEQTVQVYRWVLGVGRPVIRRLPVAGDSP